ncbi:hypothetical protein A2316_01240 [Candidatus Falkowbacteria bacterium RIFOXYB2_FULL_38_15]|uniref:Uncharacterized protein n=1 Tax=Candidatus Falkowbacteria bacterium RIFOXYA2_FULL_38_12 TaxID=1797993 RepID=A0A1F5S4N6_9BACT|nr:MAG: hypothetical protein A2257_02640 [Candidatus Falkowbacteria bacterium RIFOXYA2_FULL_38_12]OGF32805.1 MAG: hypothetical protein A2316_01240 [Candidatus Falkowbacteria bacterium RIFOXYB2_FULL_38_15]OGF42157.1 MAG: hypothetical protein A2555_02645 [Candidatus Falkowbacteria bacterium RIFOXYD2_FULL_39_16]
MNIFSKKLFVVLISFILFSSSVNLVRAGDIQGMCSCGVCALDPAPVRASRENLLEEMCAEICARPAPGCAAPGSERVTEISCVGGGAPDPILGCTDGGSEEKSETEKSTVKAIQLESPIEDTDIVPLIGRVIKTALGVVGAIALLMFVYGGLIWLTSGGSPDKIKKGMDVLIWVAIGLVVIFASYTLVDFVFTAFGIS